jgi:hypothetical protein
VVCFETRETADFVGFVSRECEELFTHGPQTQICRHCLKTMLLTQCFRGGRNTGVALCTDAACRRPLSNADVQRWFTADELEEYDQGRRRDNPRWRECLNCGHGDIYSEQEKFTCSNCEVQSCFPCRVLLAGHDCTIFQTQHAQEADDILRTAIHADPTLGSAGTGNEETYYVCPGCGKDFLDGGGCFHVGCKFIPISNDIRY